MLQTGEVARMLGVSPNTVRDYVRRGWLSCVFSTNGRRTFYEKDVKEFPDKYTYYAKSGGDEK